MKNHIPLSCNWMMGFLIAGIACAEDRVEEILFRQRAGEMDITIDGQLFATYVWSDPKTTRPYFKQLHALGGEVQMTRNHPPGPGDFPDHETYHPGVWWGFGDVGGNDYWRMKAKIIGGSFLEEPTGGKDRGSFAVRNRLLTNDGKEIFCEQICRYTILRCPQGILMICESTFQRDKSDFWLGDQEEMGLAVRVATPLTTKVGQGGVIRDSMGRTEHQAIRTNQSDWCDYSGPIAGKHGGILLMNDPANFRRPWWHAVDTGLLVANPLGESELNGRGKQRENVLVKQGEPFHLRYGIFVHLHGSAEQFNPAKAYQEFLNLLPEVDQPKISQTRIDLPTVPADFHIAIHAREPRVYKPTAICLDAKNRLLVGQGPQYPRNLENTPTDSVVLLIDSDNDGRIDESKTFATGFNSVQGLAWKGSDLYVANAPELTVVRDLDGDDEADEYIMVYTDLGNCEHALHGLNWAPDGKLYMSKGNSKGHNQPEKYGCVAPRPFRELWDVVHPPGAPDTYPPRTFSKQSYKNTYHYWDDDWGREGGVLRCDPLGANLEIVSRGLRNPWDMALDDGFNWLGTDNDQHQGDRIIMPFFGAHFGWGHTYSSHWTGEDHLPTAPVSGPVFPGSGTGIVFYAHSHFPSPYRHVFFVNDWLHGTYVYRPVWDGALMQPAEGRWERFAWREEGKMLYRPTDIEFAADGSIYICGWGGNYHYDRETEGSWIFRITSGKQSTDADARSDSEKRDKPYEQWSVQQLLEDLGPECIPVWRVNAQEELVRRGEGVRDMLIAAIESGNLSQGQQTWAVWALGRMAPADALVEEFIGKMAQPLRADKAHGVPMNLRIQALRILAYRARAGNGKLPGVVVAALSDPEPRIRFEVVQSIWQARSRKHVGRLVDQLAEEQDRLVYYSTWRALRELTDVNFRKGLLEDQRSGVRLAGLLSLLEGHEITLNEVLAIAEGDSDTRIQNWAMTWAMNPRPPDKMPNSMSRIELEASVSMRDLIERAKGASSAKLRRLYLSMIARATFEDEDWEEIRDFYRTLRDDEERSFVIKPLARRADAKPYLWDALAGSSELRQVATRALVGLSLQRGSSPEQIAEFLLSKLVEESTHGHSAAAVEAMCRLHLPGTWRPPSTWDSIFSNVLASAKEVSLRVKIMTLLLDIDPVEIAKGGKTKAVVEKLSRAPDPQLYSYLLVLNPRLGITVEMQPPEQATIEGVLARLSHADAHRGSEMFFDTTRSTHCASCHRIAGRGKALAPDLSGVGLRSEPVKIIQSILDPNDTITEGFQLQTFAMNDGTSLSGAVLGETDAEIRLVKTDGTLEVIESRVVENRTITNLSAMPNGFALLGNEQVADIVAFLATCRHGSESTSIEN